MFAYMNRHALEHSGWTDIDRSLALELCNGIVRCIRVPSLKCASGAYFATDHSEYENAFHVLWKMRMASGFRDKRDENDVHPFESIPFNERLDYKTYGKSFSPTTYFLLGNEEMEKRLLVTKEFQAIPIIELILVSINLISGWGKQDDWLPCTNEKFTPPQSFIKLMDLCVSKGFADRAAEEYYWTYSLWEAVDIFNGIKS